MSNNCFYCKKETSNKKYCSRSCAASDLNVKFPKKVTSKKCTICGEPCESYKHSRCEKHQSEYNETRYDYIKELTLEDYWKKKSLTNLHSSSKNAHIRGLCRSAFKHLTKIPCHNCNYDKHVELCHIKGVSKFPSSARIKEVNSPQNIIQLCRNCHWEFDNGLLDLGFPEQPKSQ